ncbi:hypothetical protein RHGRI_000449 [Rhododendron griersonianum]|uniref:Uncharacterized protein n=1 Tax=Rhododendron griersonianum TaxID=479676 RepID=A0AAV6LJN7_9ERIC|nr:hypothetical protein RHGRI_000449 [Rhododendron griersonianum]
MTRIPFYGWIIGTPWVHCIRNLAAGWCLILEGLLGLRWTQLLMMVGGDLAVEWNHFRAIRLSGNPRTEWN